MRKKLFILIVIVLFVGLNSVCLGYAISQYSFEKFPIVGSDKMNDNISKESDIYSIVAADKNCYVYDYNFQKKLVSLKKNDSMLIFDIDEKNGEAKVFLSEIDSPGFIKLKNLQKNKEGKIKLGKVNFDLKFVSEKDNSLYIFSEPDIHSEKIGVLRKGIVLPVVEMPVITSIEDANSKFYAIGTYNGVGYIRYMKVRLSTMTICYIGDE